MSSDPERELGGGAEQRGAEDLRVRAQQLRLPRPELRGPWRQERVLLRQADAGPVLPRQRHHAAAGGGVHRHAARHRHRQGAERRQRRGGGQDPLRSLRRLRPRRPPQAVQQPRRDARLGPGAGPRGARFLGRGPVGRGGGRGAAELCACAGARLRGRGGSEQRALAAAGAGPDQPRVCPRGPEAAPQQTRPPETRV